MKRRRSAGLKDDDSKNLDDITFSTQTGPAWAGSERDYTYDEVNALLALSVIVRDGADHHYC